MTSRHLLESLASTTQKTEATAHLLRLGDDLQVLARVLGQHSKQKRRSPRTSFALPMTSKACPRVLGRHNTKKTEAASHLLRLADDLQVLARVLGQDVRPNGVRNVALTQLLMAQGAPHRGVVHFGRVLVRAVEVARFVCEHRERLDLVAALAVDLEHGVSLLYTSPSPRD